MERKVAAIATIDVRVRTTRSARILEPISDKDQRRPTTRSGWTAGDELNPPPAPERTGPSLAPFLRHRRGDRWWRVGIGFLYVPTIIVVITVEDWLGISQGIMWISLGVFFLAFLAFILLADRLMTGD